uniref:Uncharacterized protein n=1 Tax=Arundo donax TaxID=35708 RepID=A0A0A9FC04_ARUDO
MLQLLEPRRHSTRGFLILTRTLFQSLLALMLLLVQGKFLLISNHESLKWRCWTSILPP